MVSSVTRSSSPLSRVQWLCFHIFDPALVNAGLLPMSRSRNARALSESMLKPLIESKDYIIGLEPRTLLRIREENPILVAKLLEKILKREIDAYVAFYSNAFLPQMLSDNRVFAEINAYWSLSFFYNKLLNRKRHDEYLALFFSEGVYGGELLELIDNICREVLGRTCKMAIITCNKSKRISKNIPELADLAPFLFFVKLRAYEVLRNQGELVSLREEDFREGEGLLLDMGKLCAAVRENKVDIASIEARISNLLENVQLTLLSKLLKEASKRSVEKRTKDFLHSCLRPLRRSLSPFETEQIVVSSRLSEQMIWSGVEPPVKAGSRRLYYTVFAERIQGQVFLRILSSAWKVAFNTIRREVSNFVFSELKKIVQSECSLREFDFVSFLKEYGELTLGIVDREHFLKKYFIKGELMDFIKAFQWACQDAYDSFSCISNTIENEHVSRSLSFMARSLAFLARYYYERDLEEELKKVCSIYRELFLEFGRSTFWMKLIRSWDFNWKALAYFLSSLVSKNGASPKAFAHRSISDDPFLVSLDFYNTAFKSLGLKVWFYDVNPILLQLMFYDLFDRKRLNGLLGKFIKQELLKSINPYNQVLSLVERIGVWCLRAFPEDGKMLGVSKELIRTVEEYYERFKSLVYKPEFS